MIRIFICEDDARFRRLLVKIVAAVADFEVVGQASTGEEACARLGSGGADLLLLARRFWNYFASVQGTREVDYGLTDEELQVLTLVGRGLSNPETARVLHASRRTIKGHLERIYRTLGVTGRVDATVKALQAGLIDL